MGSVPSTMSSMLCGSARRGGKRTLQTTHSGAAPFEGSHKSPHGASSDEGGQMISYSRDEIHRGVGSRGIHDEIPEFMPPTHLR